MLTARVRIRNMEALALGVPALAEIKVGEVVLLPGEEQEFEFTEAADIKIKIGLTKDGEDMKKEIEEADQKIEDERAGGVGKKKEDYGITKEPGPGSVGPTKVTAAPAGKEVKSEASRR